MTLIYTSIQTPVAKNWGGLNMPSVSYLISQLYTNKFHCKQISAKICRYTPESGAHVKSERQLISAIKFQSRV